MDFATKLRTLRTARGMTQQQLADLTGVPNTSISNMETGRIEPAGPWLIAIKRELRWPEDESLFDALAAVEPEQAA